MTEPIQTRMQALASRIAAAREQLAKREGFENDEVGDILHTINEDLEKAHQHDSAAAHEALDKIEARLADLAPLLSVLPR